jgi:putative ABC transport system permease protein
MGLRRFFRRAKWDDERRRELESYIDIETDANIARGLDPAEARARAHRKLGNATLAREEIYQMNTMSWIESFWLDVKFGARVLRKSPAFTIVALLSLALGVGANAALFQLLDIVMLRSLPLERPEEIVEVQVPPGPGRVGAFMGSRPQLTNPQWELLRTRQSSLTDLFAYGVVSFELADGGESRPIPGLFVSGGYFDALRSTASAGRLIGPTDDVRGCPPIAVLGHGLWQREFAGAADVTSRTIRLDGELVPIAGVVPQGFRGIDVTRQTDVFVPICARPHLKKENPALDVQNVWWLAVFGRLKPGVSIAQASSEMSSLAPAIFAETVWPRYDAITAKAYLANTLKVESAEKGVSTLRTRYGTSLTLLLSIAGLVFLIACANLANLMLARASTRGREIAVRLAIGASRLRVFRQLIAESLLLAAAGAAAGLGLALLLSKLLVLLLTSDGSAWALDRSIDWRLTGFSIGLAVVACLLFGLAPAVRSTRTPPGALVHLGGRGTAGDRHRLIVRRLLVVGQIGVSLVLVVGALLFTGTLRNLGHSDHGFSENGVLALFLDLRPAGVRPDAMRTYQADLVDELKRLPAVRYADSMEILPVSGSSWNESIVIDGKVQEDYPDANRVGPAFFGALDIAFIAGRNFDERDRLGSPPTVIVNAAFRDKFLSPGNPIGRRFNVLVGPGQPNPTYEVIGVVENSTYRSLRDPLGPQMYFASAQQAEPGPFLTVALRTDGDPGVLRLPAADVIRKTHPKIVVTSTVMAEEIRSSLLRERLMAALSGGFAILAVILAAVGLYGLMAYGVARRRNEIGIRVALGANAANILTMILRETVWLVALGLTLGVVGAVYAARAAQALLFGLAPSDPSVIAVAAATVAAIAALASVVPASRAVRLQPTTALREET